eukprot:gene14082-biopygen5081
MSLRGPPPMQCYKRGCCRNFCHLARDGPAGAAGAGGVQDESIFARKHAKPDECHHNAPFRTNAECTNCLVCPAPSVGDQPWRAPLPSDGLRSGSLRLELLRAVWAALGRRAEAQGCAAAAEGLRLHPPTPPCRARHPTPAQACSFLHRCELFCGRDRSHFRQPRAKTLACAIPALL